MTPRPYPHLARLLGGYFHQDCYDDGDSDADIVATYVATQTPASVAATAEDIDTLIREHGQGLLAAFDRLFKPDIIIGETDAEARDWLAAISAGLRRG